MLCLLAWGQNEEEANTRALGTDLKLPAYLSLPRQLDGNICKLSGAASYCMFGSADKEKIPEDSLMGFGPTIYYPTQYPPLIDACPEINTYSLNLAANI